MMLTASSAILLSSRRITGAAASCGVFTWVGLLLHWLYSWHQSVYGCVLAESGTSPALCWAAVPWYCRIGRAAALGIDFQLKDVIAFSILVLVLIFRPSGFLGEKLSQEKV
jgi:uncharacterized membrane protein